MKSTFVTMKKQSVEFINQMYFFLGLGLVSLVHSSCVHIWTSKPFPIRITVIRMTFQGMDSYFKSESRLTIWQSFNTD